MTTWRFVPQVVENVRSATGSFPEPFGDGPAPYVCVLEQHGLSSAPAMARSWWAKHQSLPKMVVRREESSLVAQATEWLRIGRLEWVRATAQQGLDVWFAWAISAATS